jgi:hypothetical protein
MCDVLRVQWALVPTEQPLAELPLVEQVVVGEQLVEPRPHRGLEGLAADAHRVQRLALHPDARVAHL